MAKWYEICPLRLRDEPEPVAVARFTDKTVTVRPDFGRERRHARIGSYAEFYPTWEEAHARLLDLADVRLRRARIELQNAQGCFGNVKGMKAPE